jgi:ABC-type Na+ transport system ATPase subunit NatA
MDGLFGNIYSAVLTGSAISAGDDLVEILKDKINTDSGSTLIGNLNIKKVSFITKDNIGIDFNSRGFYSRFWVDSNGDYKFSLDGNDVFIRSMIVESNLTNSLNIAIIY